MEVERKRSFLVKVGYFTFIFLAGFLALRYAVAPLMPALVGLFVAWLLRPVSAFLQRHSAIGGRGGSIISTLLFYGLLCVIVCVVALGLSRGIQGLSRAIPNIYQNGVRPAIEQYRSILAKMFGSSGQGGVGYAGMDALAERLSSLGVAFAAFMLQKAPAFGLGVVVAILSTALFGMYYDQLSQFVLKQIPARLHQTIRDVFRFIAVSLLRSIRAQFLLMVITFLELVAALFILQVENFLLIAGIIAVLDMLPIIGSGAVLVPWAAYGFMTGNSFMAVGLLISWAIISVVRECIEPKVIGKELGLHPIVALLSIYAGFVFAGFWGVIYAPLACLLVQYLNESDIIKIYK